MKKILKHGLLGLAGLGLVLFLVIRIAWWFDEHQMIWQSPIQISFHKPLQIVERELLKPAIIEVVQEFPEIKELTPLTSLESVLNPSQHYCVFNLLNNGSHITSYFQTRLFNRVNVDMNCRASFLTE